MDILLLATSAICWSSTSQGPGRTLRNKNAILTGAGQMSGHMPERPRHQALTSVGRHLSKLKQGSLDQNSAAMLKLLTSQSTSKMIAALDTWCIDEPCRWEVSMEAPVLFSLTFLAMSLAAYSPASASDRIGFRPGVNAEAAYGAINGKCPDSDVGPPNITCVRGGFILTATTTIKGRINWLRLMEKADTDPLTYARELAAELGMPGEPKSCHVYDGDAYCFTDSEGTVLAAGSSQYEGYRTSYFFNDRFLEEDGGLKK